MKEDKLENFVQENAEDFNSFEPPTMAWEVIEKEIAQQSKNRQLWPYAWKIAAAVLIFTAAWMLNDYLDQKKGMDNNLSKNGINMNSEPTELSDAEAYYTTQISNKQNELIQYTKQHPEIILDLKKEFIEMDKSKAELKKDLAQSNADEKVIEAIILSYRVKLEILDQVLDEMRKSKGHDSTQKPVETNL